MATPGIQNGTYVPSAHELAAPISQPRLSPEEAVEALQHQVQSAFAAPPVETGPDFFKGILRLWANQSPLHELAKFLDPAMNPIVYGANLARLAGAMSQIFESWGWPHNQALPALLMGDQLDGFVGHALRSQVEGLLQRVHPSTVNNAYYAPDPRVAGQLAPLLDELFEPRNLDNETDRRLKALAKGLYDRDHPILSRAAPNQVTYRTLLNQTEFFRRNGEWRFLRNEWAPYLDKPTVLVGDLGPGYIFTPGLIQGRAHFTFEPFLLADLDPRIRVFMHDFFEESGRAVKEFDGHMLATANWHLPEAGVSPEELAGNFGPDYRQYLGNIKDAYEGFLKRNNGVEVGAPRTFKRDHESWAPLRQIRIAPKIKDRIYAMPPGDLGMAPIHGPLDAVYAHFNNPYLETDSRMYWGIATLIRCVDELVPGGFLITDPHIKQHPRGPVLMTHSPSPEMAQVLGLKLAADLSREDFSVIFYKQGPSNELVRTIATRLNRRFERKVPRFSADRQAVWSRRQKLFANQWSLPESHAGIAGVPLKPSL